MQRTRLYDCKLSRIPGIIGACVDDTPKIARYVNTAQRQLLMCKEATDEGWWGTWAEIVFTVSRNSPYITLPREIARLEAVNVCDQPVQLQNQFFEYLTFGNGRLPKTRCNCQSIPMAYSRNNAITFLEMYNLPQYLVAYATDERDYGKRILLSGLDAGNENIVTTDVTNQVNGQFLVFNNPAPQTPQVFNQLTGIQKDITKGMVRIYQHDPTTGDEVLLLTMQASETTALYRRYYMNQLPRGCCTAPGSTDDTEVQVTAIAKLDLIPVLTDTDYCLIQNIEALTEQCASVRYSEMDSPQAKDLSRERHNIAISYLNGELNHYIGKNKPAVGMEVFGSARLGRQRVGRLW